MSDKKDLYAHAHYKHCDEKEADGIAWTFLDKNQMVKFPFKFEPLKPDELRANILYAGLCASDVHTVRSEWGPASYPIAPGHEIMAEVCEVGKDVKDFKKGDLIGFGTIRSSCDNCNYCNDKRENLCDKMMGTYGEYWGGYSTALQAKANWCFHLPKGFNIQKGAPCLCAGITTYYPIERYLKPDIKKKCGVIGCGGLGHMAIQILHKYGQHVTAFTTSPNKKELLTKLGADNIVISTDAEQMNKAKNSIDFMINSLSCNDGMEKYIDMMAKGGIFVQVGLPEIGEAKLNLNLFPLVLKELVVTGSLVGPREATNRMLKFCAEKDVYPYVEEFTFEDFPKAFEKLEHGRPFFRCVVNVKDYAEKHGLKK